MTGNEMVPLRPKRKPKKIIEVADKVQVEKVLRLMSQGMTFAAACGRCQLPKLAVRRRILADGALKRDLAAHLIMEAHDRADVASAAGNVGALGVFAKLSKDMAASLAPGDWGDKTIVEGRVLVIHSNLFAAPDGEEIDGFAATLPDAP